MTSFYWWYFTEREICCWCSKNSAAGCQSWCIMSVKTVLFNVGCQETSISAVSEVNVFVSVCLSAFEKRTKCLWVSNNGRFRVELQVWSKLPNRTDMSPRCPTLVTVFRRNVAILTLFLKYLLACESQVKQQAGMWIFPSNQTVSEISGDF